MRYRALTFSFLLAAAALAGCTKAPATPLETFKTYVKAMKQDDTATMKLLLSDATIKMHQRQAEAQGVTVDEVIKRETLVSESQRAVEFRNEKIMDDQATLEVKNAFGAWETVPFIREGGSWKIDKQGYANRMIQEIEQQNQRLDDMINNPGREPSY